MSQCLPPSHADACRVRALTSRKTPPGCNTLHHRPQGILVSSQQTPGSTGSSATCVLTPEECTPSVVHPAMEETESKHQKTRMVGVYLWHSDTMAAASTSARSPHMMASRVPLSMTAANAASLYCGMLRQSPTSYCRQHADAVKSVCKLACKRIDIVPSGPHDWGKRQVECSRMPALNTSHSEHDTCVLRTDSCGTSACRARRCSTCTCHGASAISLLTPQ
jgi:hypothetical protein